MIPSPFYPAEFLTIEFSSVVSSLIGIVGFGGSKIGNFDWILLKIQTYILLHSPMWEYRIWRQKVLVSRYQWIIETLIKKLSRIHTRENEWRVAIF